MQSIREGALVLASSRRLARHLAHQYGSDQVARGIEAWETPGILFWSDWIELIWRDIREQDNAEVLLNADQERVVWEQVIMDDALAGGIMLQPAVTARSALKTYRLLREWCLSPQNILAEAEGDARVFATWGISFERICTRNRWVSVADLPDRLCKARLNSAERLPDRVHLAGFDEFTPRQESLWAALRDAGVEVDAVPPAKPAGRSVRTVLSDAGEEFEAAARWTRRTIEQDATASVAVVIPSLETCRERVIRIFEDILVPGAAAGRTPVTSRPFNISLGCSLAAEAVVCDALLLLNLMAGPPRPLQEVSRLLRSPYLAGAAQELSQRASFDARIRADGETELSLGDLLQRLRGVHDSVAACPILEQHLDDLYGFSQEIRGRDSPDHRVWAWTRALLHAGWPGDRGLDSTEYQALQAFREQLSQFAALALVVPRQDPSRALTALKRMVSECIFQPETPDAPIQILGLMEGAGMRFSHLWVCAMHDETWPARPEPDPFLPISLQRRLGMPHSGAERELEYARRVTKRLMCSAENIIFSHAAFDQDRPLRSSPLLAELVQADPQDLPTATLPAFMDAIHAAQPELQELSDTAGPFVDQAEVFAGGAKLFQDQAACPFRAFACYRLGATPLETPGHGLSARDRGTLIHQVLEGVWRELRSWSRLQALDEAGRVQLVEACVERVLERFRHGRSRTLRGRFRDLEHRRLTDRVVDFLGQELERPPFEVRRQEQQRRVSVNGLTVSLRLDRVDRLADGRDLLIDYKTGQVRITDWCGERPADPQLPLYCIVHEHEVAGIAYAVIRKGETGYRGVCDSTEPVPGLTVPGQGGRGKYAEIDWPTLNRAWKTSLDGLAAEFLRGEARVDPIQPPLTCTYCDIAPLCRVHEQQSWLSTGEGGA